MSAPVFKDDPLAYIIYWLHWIIATFGMGWSQALAFWREVDPDTGMTQYQTVQYLEETQTPREQEAERKSQIAGQAAYEHYKPIAEEKEKQDKLYREVAAEMQKMDEAEKAKALREQDEIEERNQFKQEKAQAENQSRTHSARNTVNTARIDPEPTPVPRTPTPDPKYIIEPVESKAQQDYERAKIEKAETLTSKEPDSAAGTPVTDMSAYDQYEARRLL